MTQKIDMRDSWNKISPHYQESAQIPADFAHYGPHCPNEDQLQLVGDVKGKHILEIGCGGGQCSIAFARRGAIATGIDLSDAQLEHARQLAAKHNAKINFMQGNIEDLPGIQAKSWDVVFSAYALCYVENLPRCFDEVYRVLKPGGLFVFSLDHPFWDCISDDDMRIINSYHATGPAEWDWNFPKENVYSRMRSFHHKVGDWYRMLTAAGFEVLEILEPEPVEVGSGSDWGGDYAPERQRMVPATIIWKVKKPE